jgi:hypothetical protein
VSGLKARNAQLITADNSNILAFEVNSSSIEFVVCYRFLGHVISTQFDDFGDILDKQAIFSSKSVIL